ncbi:MAG: 3-oxoacyl-ACP reductase [Gemmatales bacterium]|nr:MAG: 3-oxoacyl-ACP reductase [Gemmatales bacterium]
MDLGLANAKAVVIGAAQGIGRAIAEGFAQEKAEVLLVDRAASVFETAKQIAADHSVPASSFVADVVDPTAVQRCADDIEARCGRIDHVVFAVAIGSGQFGFPFLNVAPENWEPVLRVNLLGAVHVAHAFGPKLIATGGGTMLFLSSVAGQIGSQTDPPYSASKAALINFAQCVAKDLAAHNIRVNTLCPGMVKTALNRSVWEAWHRQQPPDRQQSYEDWAGEKVRKVIPLGRWQEPEDIANMAVFLASNRARNVTGQTINVDGGFVMHW